MLENKVNDIITHVTLNTIISVVGFLDLYNSSGVPNLSTSGISTMLDNLILTNVFLILNLRQLLVATYWLFMAVLRLDYLERDFISKRNWMFFWGDRVSIYVTWKTTKNCRPSSLEAVDSKKYTISKKYVTKLCLSLIEVLLSKLLW